MCVFSFGKVGDFYFILFIYLFIFPFGQVGVFFGYFVCAFFLFDQVGHFFSICA